MTQLSVQPLVLTDSQVAKDTLQVANFSNFWFEISLRMKWKIPWDLTVKAEIIFVSGRKSRIKILFHGTCELWEKINGVVFSSNCGPWRKIARAVKIQNQYRSTSLEMKVRPIWIHQEYFVICRNFLTTAVWGQNFQGYTGA